MRISNLLAGSALYGLSIPSLEESDEGGGGTPAPSPAPAPAPTPTPAPADEPLLNGGEDEELTDEQKAEAATKAEDDRRAALSDDERAEEDRRAALTDEERAAEDKAKEDEEAKTGAPEEYKFEFEGEDAPQLNEAMLEEFTGLLREDNLTQEQANRYMGFAQKLQESWLGQVTDAHIAARTEWRKAAQADPEIGGDKFNENLAVANQAVKDFGDAELVEFFKTTGFGDNPAVIRAFYKMGKANSEHDFVKSGKPTTAKPFYDHETSQPKG